MKVTFLGVGEAFDERLANNSHLIEAAGMNLLLDCGYAIPHQLWKHNDDQSLLDALYISHGHADHYFGIPALLMRMWEGERTKPFTIICRDGLKEGIEQLMELGYRNFTPKFNFPLNFLEVSPGEAAEFNGLQLTFARTGHMEANLAIRISDGTNSVCYSGDGRHTPTSSALFEGADLVIHEAYSFDTQAPGHGCVTKLVPMAIEQGVGCLALTHLQRDFRRKGMDMLREYCAQQQKQLKIIIPEPEDVYNL